MTRAPWLRLRTSEWVLVGFFAYVALISPLFHNRPHLHGQPILIFLAIVGLLIVLSTAEQTQKQPVISRARDWLPILLTLFAFWEMEFFLPTNFPHRFETTWIAQDRVFLTNWHARAAIESLGKAIPLYLEFCYLLVYGLAAYCVAVLYIQRRRASIDRFFTIYLLGTLGAYALFPYFPSQPPRLLFPGVATHVVTWVRELNLYILSKGTIHVSVFPSAHVSSAFSAAWAMFLLFPRRPAFGWVLLVYAASVSLATIYGRYHYAADVLAGFGISLLAGAVGLWCRRAAH